MGLNVFDDLRAAGIAEKDAIGYDIRMRRCPGNYKQAADEMIAALARLAIGYKGDADSARLDWKAAHKIAEAWQRKSDAKSDMIADLRAERDRARNLAVGLEQECARLRGVLPQGGAGSRTKPQEVDCGF